MRAIAAVGLTFVVALLLVSAIADAAPPKRVKAKGQISTVAPGKILFLDEANKLQRFNILSDREVGITVQGKLELADLKPGMLARVEGSLKATSLEGEVAKVTVFSVNDGYQQGIIQDSKDQPAVITGTVKLLKDDVLTLTVGKKRLTAKLAKDAVVEVDSKDYSLAPTGALIEADGYETKDGSVNAKKIVITVGKVEKKAEKLQDSKTAKTAKKKEEKK